MSLFSEVFFVMRLSVIVPVYNVEAYLPCCLQSLQKQTLKDMEVILVDDGSTDGSSVIAERFAESDPRFRYFRKENGGLSDARNFGLPYAEGDYIAFLDSDDWVEEDLYERMVSEIRDADVCIADLEYVWQDSSRNFVMKGLTDWKTDTVNQKALLSPLFAWNKIYKAELFKGEGGYRYPLHTWYEDHPVTTMIFAKAKKIAYLPYCGFRYRQREGSIMAATDDPRILQIFDVLAMVRKNFTDAGLFETYRTELEYLHIEHLRLYGMFRFIRSSQWKTCYERSEAVMRENFPDWKHNPYLKNLGWKNRMFLQVYSPLTSGLFHTLIR
ncbi:MAG: glycosyltransferase [Solobacterium sp.]|nr:glycosyltransferase [Solobacterium sp.]